MSQAPQESNLIEQTSSQVKQNSQLFLKTQQETEVIAPQGYYFIKTLGDGSFGKVKLGVHQLTDQKVAIKILCKDRIRERTDIQRISRQIKILKLVMHPFVVQMYQIIQTPKYLFLVMQYVQGGDLFDAISKEQKLSPQTCKQYFSQLVLGLQYLHGLGITHRDVKPENILLGQYGKIKIADFGLGNFFTEGTKLKTACGSPCYAPPEMLNQVEYDPTKVDIWSSGVLLYAMVHGYLPFQDQKTSILYEKIKTKNPKVASQVGIPCRNLLRGILNKNPDERWSIDIIKSHQYLSQDIQKEQQYVSLQIGQVNTQDFHSICEQLGIVEQERLLKNLNKNKHNNLTTLYYLGKKKILREIVKDMSQQNSMEPQPLPEQKQPLPIDTQKYSKANSQSQIVAEAVKEQKIDIQQQQTKMIQTVQAQEQITVQQSQKTQIQGQIQISSNEMLDSKSSFVQEEKASQIIPKPLQIQQQIFKEKQKQIKNQEIPIKDQKIEKQKIKPVDNPVKPPIKQKEGRASFKPKMEHQNRPINSPKLRKDSIHNELKTTKQQRIGLKKSQRMPIVKAREQNWRNQQDIKLYERSHSKDKPLLLKNNLNKQRKTLKGRKQDIGIVTSKAVHSQPHIIDAERIVLCSAQRLCDTLSLKGLNGKIQYYSYNKNCIFVTKAQLKPVKVLQKKMNGDNLEKIISQINQTVINH